MLKRIAAATMPVALAFASAWALAQSNAQSGAETDGSTAPPAYAQTAARLASAIQSGEDLRAHKDMFPLIAEEFAELAKLKGCEGAVLPVASGDTVVFKWTCGLETSVPGLARTTAMVFEPDGVLYSFAINQSLDQLAVSPGGAAQKGGNTHEFAMRFARAVTRGEDPGLGGILPLTSLDRARLTGFDGGDSNVRQGQMVSQLEEVKTIRAVSFSPKHGRSRRVAYLYFDADDRPMGLIFAPVRNPAVKRRKLDDGSGYQTHQENRRRQQGQPGCVFC